MLVAIGTDVAVVMEELGHADPRFTLRVYAHAMRRSEDERERLRAFVQGEELPPLEPANGQKRAEIDSEVG